MPPFPKPTFSYDYRLSSQIEALREYKDTTPGRSVPTNAKDRLLVANWNVDRLGVQDRRDQDYRLIAEIVGWFDLVAVQEVNDDLSGLRGLRAVHELLLASFRMLFSDAAGNDEHLAFLYDSDKIILMEEVGEIAMPASELRGNDATGSCLALAAPA
jgi:hypothetical protein